MRCAAWNGRHDGPVGSVPHDVLQEVYLLVRAHLITQHCKYKKVTNQLALIHTETPRFTLRVSHLRWGEWVVLRTLSLPCNSHLTHLKGKQPSDISHSKHCAEDLVHVLRQWDTKRDCSQHKACGI